MNTATLNTQNMIILALIIILFLILFFYFYSKNKGKRINKQFDDLHVRFNTINSIPLSYKLNKADSISKIDEEIALKVEEIKKEYATTTTELEHLLKEIEETHDLVLSKKYKNIQNEFNNLEAKIQTSEKKVNDINAVLDTILERESQERAKSNVVKKKFLDLSNQFNEEIVRLGVASKNIEDRITECSEMFSNFEDWMYASEYVKATECLASVDAKIDETKVLIEKTPEFLEIATRAIPTLYEQTKKQYSNAMQKNLYIDHLDVERRLSDANALLEDTKFSIQVGQLNQVQENLLDVTERLRSLLREFSKEESSRDNVEKIISLNDRVIEQINHDYEYIVNCYQLDKDKFNLNEYEELVQAKDHYLNYYNNEQHDLKVKVKNHNMASTDIEALAIDFIKTLEQKQNDLKDIKNMIDNAKKDEERAINESSKFQVGLNLVRMNVLAKKLPSVSEDYLKDVEKGYTFIDKVKAALQEIPIQQANLKNLVDEMIDYTVKLYTATNNIIEISEKVEKIIVIANKYRTSYPDIDGEITVAELQYQNGSYLQAYQTVLSALTKIFPESRNRELIQTIQHEK